MTDDTESLTEFIALIPRNSSEMPGTTENLEALHRLLSGWRCCGAPNLCSAGCRNSELSAVLADAARVVAKQVLKDDK